MESPPSGNRVLEAGLQTQLQIVWRRKWFIFLPVLLVTALAVLATLFLITPKYGSTTELLQRRSGLDRVLLGTDVFIQNFQPERTLETAAAMIKSPEVTSAVTAELGDRLDGENPASKVTVEVLKRADILLITAIHEDADLAAAIADSYARNYIEWRNSVDREIYSDARQSIEEQLASLPPDMQQGSVEYQVLADNLQSLKLLESMESGMLEVIKPAFVSDVPVSPNPRRNGALAFIASLLAATVGVLFYDRIDTKVRNAEQITGLINKPILANIPKSAESGSDLVTMSNPNSPGAESYRLLKTNLSYVAPDRKLKSILVTSAEPCEGKSTVITNLAITMARAGQRVIVIEGDLRRPMLAKYLNLDDSYGVSNAVVGNCTLREAMQMIDKDDLSYTVFREGGIVRETTTDGFKSIKPIYCATSGPLPPNPAELISSERMTSLIHEAEDNCDYVLIDSPPLGVVSDAAGMASSVDGIILVVRLSRTSKKSLQRMKHFVDSVPGNVLGFVIIGTSIGAGGGYYYSNVEYYK